MINMEKTREDWCFVFGFCFGELRAPRSYCGEDIRHGLYIEERARGPRQKRADIRLDKALESVSISENNSKP